MTQDKNTEPEAYVLFDEQMAKLLTISKTLHGGSDAMRDEGHRLWLVLNEVQEQPVFIRHEGTLQ